jgi:hypothetical protein
VEIVAPSKCCEYTNKEKGFAINRFWQVFKKHSCQETKLSLTIKISQKLYFILTNPIVRQYRKVFKSVNCGFPITVCDVIRIKWSLGQVKKGKGCFEKTPKSPK